MNASAGPSGGPSNLTLRILSAAVLIPLALAATWAGGFWFAAFAGIIALLSVHEWLTISGTPHLSARSILAFGALAGSAVVYYITGWPLLAVFIIAAVAAIAWGFAGEPRWVACASVWHPALPFIALTALREQSQSGFASIVFLFAVVWATDIFAYFAGKSIGGPKLAPSISPGKTWSGAIGGTVCGIIAGLVAGWYFNGHSMPALAFLALGMSVAGQVGDLLESRLKRIFGVKDSGNLIPGHGGVLDRVDALVIAAIVLWAAASLMASNGHPSVYLFAG